MIGKLKGIVDEIGEGWMILDVGGVGYLVSCSSTTLRGLGGPGDPAALLIETYVREDQFRLFGFLDVAERDWFKILQSVQGVGARVALAVLGTLGIVGLTSAINTQDKKAVAQTSGVGPKLAARIVSELKDKVPSSALSLQVGTLPEGSGNGSAITLSSGPAEDAISALVNLGYPDAHARQAIGAAAAVSDEGATAEMLIRRGLKELAR
ncbi:MAG: Holliday junction branch migration protein RuvA [Rhodobiaceae bacterium]|nr:Holliday junction branch migration protein RuvA [Rhodobiaceae bacterium]